MRLWLVLRLLFASYSPVGLFCLLLAIGLPEPLRQQVIVRGLLLVLAELG